MTWRVKFKLFKLSTYSIVFAVIALLAIVTGKYIETIALFASFVFIRNTFGKTYHANLFWVCIEITIAVFIVAITFMPSVHTSLLGCIVFGLVIDFVAYKAKDYADIREELAYKNKQKVFSTDTCTLAELIKRCKEVKLSQENTMLAIEFFVKKTKHSVLAERLAIDEKSVTAKKQRLKEKLNT